MPIERLQVPRTSRGTLQHPVSLLVADEFLFFGVPSEFAAQPNRNIIQVANCVRADGCFDGANRLLSCLDTIQKVAPMIVANRQVYLI